MSRRRRCSPPFSELHFVVGNVAGPAQSLSIRSGVTSGYVILMEGDDYIGHCVNVAARLCDLADAGEALASPSVMDYLPRWGLTLSYRDVMLRGVEKPVEPPVSVCRNSPWANAVTPSAGCR